MSIILPILGILFVYGLANLIMAICKTPEGFQDTNGFHLVQASAHKASHTAEEEMAAGALQKWRKA